VIEYADSFPLPGERRDHFDLLSLRAGNIPTRQVDLGQQHGIVGHRIVEHVIIDVPGASLRKLRRGGLPTLNDNGII